MEPIVPHEVDGRNAAAAASTAAAAADPGRDGWLAPSEEEAAEAKLPVKYDD